MDIELLYTGASADGESQTAPRSSLGGYVSSSVIPNGQLANLFMNIGLLSTTKFETKGIVLKNTSGSTITNLEFWFTIGNDEIFNAEIGAVWIGSSGSMELLQNTYSIPYSITFEEALVDSKVGIGSPTTGNILDDEMVGLWIKRINDRDAIKTMLDCDNLYTKYQADEVVYDPESSLVLNFTYDLV